ncbi:hypothetical protein RF11_10316 [Thelohanellus kitauei]|uniref:Uncharacterized protein n=1 Tax=Thelohanellus kitauei TaxID=669202 RepID=A0A0C2MF81_THEKT|nr:hypothetical protein RF11_10316 [Thelohanellus kitauei]
MRDPASSLFSPATIQVSDTIWHLPSQLGTTETGLGCPNSVESSGLILHCHLLVLNWRFACYLANCCPVPACPQRNSKRFIGFKEGLAPHTIQLSGCGKGKSCWSMLAVPTNFGHIRATIHSDGRIGTNLSVPI